MKLGPAPAPPRAGDKAELATAERLPGRRARLWSPARVVAVEGLGRILFQPLKGELVAHGMGHEGRTWRRGWQSDRVR